jgi:DNA-damage-inducible protein J
MSPLEVVPVASDTEVRARVDGRVKEKAAEVLASMGLSVSDAIRLLLTRVATEKTLPFDVNSPNAETKAAIEELERGSGARFGNVAELMTDLNAND